MDADNIFNNEINWLVDEKISTGWPLEQGAAAYRPLNPINRDAMAAFLYRAAGSPDFEAPAVSPFIDVKPEQQFYKEIAWLASEGISTGWDTPNGKEFGPLRPINRDAMAAFLFRYSVKHKDLSPDWAAPARSPFIDVSTNRMFYREIAWLSSVGISTGWDTQAGKEYRPGLAINRDAMAAFLYRWNKV